MAINAEFVRELLDGRQSDANESERTHARAFHVRLLTANLSDGPNGARVGDDGVTQVPAVGSIHPDDAFARAVSISANSMGDLRTYAVSVEYSTRSRFAGFTFNSSGTEQDYQIEDPLSRPWRYTFGLRTIERPVEQAFLLPDDGFDGNVGTSLYPLVPVQNSAGQPFDPPMLEDDYILTMTVQRYEPASSFSPLKSLAWSGVINSTDWEMATSITWPKWTAKVVAINSSSEYESGYWWWNVQYELEFYWATWIRCVLDAGWAFKDTSNKVITAVDDLGDPVSYPILLNGTGGRLPVGGTALYRKYLTKRTRPFASTTSGASLFDY